MLKHCMQYLICYSMHLDCCIVAGLKTANGCVMRRRIDVYKLGPGAVQ